MRAEQAARLTREERRAHNEAQAKAQYEYRIRKNERERNVTFTPTDTGAVVRCNECGMTWGLNQPPGHTGLSIPRGWWKCPQYCNWAPPAWDR